MNMIKQVLRLWNKERFHKGSTLQRRLILFFTCIIVGVLLLLILLLTAFGITGSGRNTVHNYAEVELAHLHDALKTDFGSLSVTGIELAESLAKKSGDFFTERGISSAELDEHSDLIEPLLAVMTPDILSVSQNNSCGGVFVLLDATVNQAPEAADTAKAGLFVKKTQPVSSGATRGKAYCLCGPASVARAFGVELLGQWKMEYDISGQEFFTQVMDTARAHPELSVSRLYYWSESVTLKGNSEAGFLLCAPLRASDGTVFGLCGIEVSSRMFQLLYSPQNEAYPRATTVAAALEGGSLHTQSGLAGGGINPIRAILSDDLFFKDENGGFAYYSGASGSYGGLARRMTVYPKDSPYANDELYAAILMPEEDLEAAIRGNSAYLFAIVLILFVCSITASVFISRRYLRPITKMFDTVKGGQETSGEFEISEINEFFELLAQQQREQAEQLESAKSEKQEAEKKYASAQKLIEQLSADKVKGFDPDRYALFCEGVNKLTKTQREIFLLYLDGCSLKEVRERCNYTTDALKWHNKEIYGKLGVSSFKELMVYAPVIKTEMERGAAH